MSCYPPSWCRFEVSIQCDVDDVMISEAMEDILHDLSVIKEAEEIDLTLNHAKSEIICNNATVRGILTCSLPSPQVVQPQKASLLGSPLGDVGSIDSSLAEKIKDLRLMDARFTYMSAHDSLTLLLHSFSIPRLHGHCALLSVKWFGRVLGHIAGNFGYCHQHLAYRE